ncbi:MAG: hypothetical protein CM15mP80_07950 [Alphaproteobacteria bacterium]|nr:MAG: hypothetical protein CM15mP80_07950 [Alphaproteobacteria bacterium]
MLFAKLQSCRQQKSEHTAIILAAEVQTALFMGLCLIVLVMELFMPFIVGGIAPGFGATPDRLHAAVDMARLTMPYLPMISLVALWAALLNSQDSYFGGAFAPVILNACLIGGAFCVPFFQEQLHCLLPSWPADCPWRSAGRWGR